MLHDVYSVIEAYGALVYAIAFLWAFLEGESFVILGGAASFHGALGFTALALAAWSGSFLGDQFYFFLGRRFGPRALARWPRFQAPTDKALKMLERYHVGFILTFRFIYGVRNVSSFAVGMSAISWRRFAALNFVAAGLWAFAFAGAGYLLARAFEALLGDIAKGFGLGMLAFFLLALSVAMWRQKRQAKATLVDMIEEEEPQDRSQAA